MTVRILICAVAALLLPAQVLSWRSMASSSFPAFMAGQCGGRALQARPRGLSQQISRPMALQQRPVARRIWAEAGEGDQVDGPVAATGGLPWFLDPNTRGGLLVVGTLGTGGVIALYQGLVATGLDGSKVGVYMSVGVTLAIILWTFSYVFRVANKDMTYVKQLKDYEDAVLRKRLSELQEDEVEALLEEVEREG